MSNLSKKLKIRNKKKDATSIPTGIKKETFFYMIYTNTVSKQQIFYNLYSGFLDIKLVMKEHMGIKLILLIFR